MNTKSWDSGPMESRSTKIGFDQIVKFNGELGFSLGLEHFVHHKTGPEMTWRDGEPIIGKLYGDHLIKRLGPDRQAE